MRFARRLIDLAHRHLWQSLPRGLRRSALVSLASVCAPRPDPAPDARGPIIVAGFLTAATGLGTSARLCYEALRSAGQPVLGIDLSAAFRQDGARLEFPFRDGSTHSGAGCLVLHINAPFVPLALWHMGARVVRRKLVIGCWAWELPEVPSEWRTGVSFVHRVIVPSTFTRDAVQPMAPGLEVAVLSYAVAALAEHTQPPCRRANDVFTALVVFNMASGFERKNPLAAIAAFQRAFGDDPTARLVVKMLNADSCRNAADRLRNLAKASANIKLDERSLTPSEMARLYDGADVVLSLHRSEGFGLVVADAMLAGRPVIATDWSGSADFLNPTTGMPVSYRLVPAIDPGGEYHNPRTVWAEADIGEAALRLRELRADPQLRARLGRAARDDAVRRFASDRFAAEFLRFAGLAGAAPGARPRSGPDDSNDH